MYRWEVVRLALALLKTGKYSARQVAWALKKSLPSGEAPSHPTLSKWAKAYAITLPYNIVKGERHFSDFWKGIEVERRPMRTDTEYLALRPITNFRMFDPPSCRWCGRMRLVKCGVRVYDTKQRAGMIRQMYRCKACGHKMDAQEGGDFDPRMKHSKSVVNFAIKQVRLGYSFRQTIEEVRKNFGFRITSAVISRWVQRFAPDFKPVRYNTGRHHSEELKLRIAQSVKLHNSKTLPECRCRYHLATSHKKP